MTGSVNEAAIRRDGRAQPDGTKPAIDNGQHVELQTDRRRLFKPGQHRGTPSKTHAQELRLGYGG
jgi:hypothetical protein